MPIFMCNTCGTQFNPADKPPANCPICDDERQFVLPTGQAWTTHEALAKRSYNGWRELEPDLFSITTFPAFGIGQRAQLLRTPNGNILWDCISLCDAATVALIKAMGGIKGIAISHPHYYSSMAEWSHAFGGVPIHLHEADKRWIMRDDPAVSLWKGETKEILPGITLICVGGHYPGGTVLHWDKGAGGTGALLSGDIVQVVADNKSVSFMWSFPNFIPLSAPAVERIVRILKPYEYDRIHGAFNHRTIWTDGKAVVERSAARYLSWIRANADNQPGITSAT